MCTHVYTCCVSFAFSLIPETGFSLIPETGFSLTKRNRILSDEEKQDSLWRRATGFSLTKRNMILSDEEKQDSLWRRETGFSVSLWRRASARNVRLYYPYWQYTDLDFDFLVQKSLAIASSYSYVYFVLFQLFSGMHHRHSVGTER